MKSINLILSLVVILLTSCAKTTENTNFDFVIKPFKYKTFDEQRLFLLRNLGCENIYENDIYNTVDNKIFRCVLNSTNAYVQIESSGYNSNNVASSKIVWKDWKKHPEKRKQEINAMQMMAVMLKLYQIKNKEAFFEWITYFAKEREFINKNFKVNIEVDEQNLYIVRKAIFDFKQNL